MRDSMRLNKSDIVFVINAIIKKWLTIDGFSESIWVAFDFWPIFNLK